MDIEIFEHRMNEFGSDINKWPDHSLRKAAETLIENSQQARDLLNQEKTIERLLTRAMFVPEPHGLSQRILNKIEPLELPRWITFLLAYQWRPAVLALVPLILGFFMGFVSIDYTDEAEDQMIFTAFADYGESAELIYE